jgi:hypothetical protein
MLQKFLADHLYDIAYACNEHWFTVLSDNRPAIFVALLCEFQFINHVFTANFGYHQNKFLESRP